MAEAFIPVDLFNPGQVFACLGFLEAADVILGGAQGGFDWSDEADVRFNLRAEGKDNPFAVLLKFVATAKVHSVAPLRSRNATIKWGLPTKTLTQDEAFPFPDPDSPATLPAVLEGTSGDGDTTSTQLVIDHWGDETCRDTVKFWGGAGGYPGAARVRDAVDLVRDRCHGAASNPFALSAEQKSSFRFDWRRDSISIDAGFSLFSHSPKIIALGFPLVELFAALGVSNARPARVRVLDYRYGVIGNSRRVSGVGYGDSFFDPTLVRVALGGTRVPFPQRCFRMSLGWPSKEGQERCITMVTEEAM